MCLGSIPGFRSRFVPLAESLVGDDTRFSIKTGDSLVGKEVSVSSGDINSSVFLERAFGFLFDFFALFVVMSLYRDTFS